MTPEYYIKIYDLEKFILNDIRNNFNRDGFLSSFDFFCIIIWKANRAKSKVAKRLLIRNPNLQQSVQELTNKIFKATYNKQKLQVLIEDYQFRLPISSAILSLLYPNDFTIYDVRVCDTLESFRGLDNLTNFENLWLGYQEYIEKVKAFEPTNISLREKDRLLWGKSFYEQLNNDIEINFIK